jgi:hypothetical protein
MDKRERELLERQLHQLSMPSRHEGATILMLVCMFLAGVTLGAIWFGHKDQPTRVASNGTVAAATLPDALSSPIR